MNKFREIMIKLKDLSYKLMESESYQLVVLQISLVLFTISWILGNQIAMIGTGIVLISARIQYGFLKLKCCKNS